MTLLYLSNHNTVLNSASQKAAFWANPMIVPYYWWLGHDIIDANIYPKLAVTSPQIIDAGSHDYVDVVPIVTF